MPSHVLGFFAAAVDPFDWIQEARHLLNSSFKSPRVRTIKVTFFALLLLFSLVLYHGCLSHPFLLSDNR